MSAIGWLFFGFVVGVVVMWLGTMYANEHS